MTEYNIIKRGKKVGVVDVTNRSVSILSDSVRIDLLKDCFTDFEREATRWSREHDGSCR